jgi:hypothetical protein
MKHPVDIGSASFPASPQGDKPTEVSAETDLDACPRCGEPVEAIIWGQTNCSRCRLYFEYC